MLLLNAFDDLFIVYLATPNSLIPCSCVIKRVYISGLVFFSLFLLLLSSFFSSTHFFHYTFASNLHRFSRHFYTHYTLVIAHSLLIFHSSYQPYSPASALPKPTATVHSTYPNLHIHLLTPTRLKNNNTMSIARWAFNIQQPLLLENIESLVTSLTYEDSDDSTTRPPTIVPVSNLLKFLPKSECEQFLEFRQEDDMRRALVGHLMVHAFFTAHHNCRWQDLVFERSADINKPALVSVFFFSDSLTYTIHNTFYSSILGNSFPFRNGDECIFDMWKHPRRKKKWLRINNIEV